ncbi:MAG: 10 kDa chaperonin [Chlamydiae bacterium]|nr:10 kDa chaperonin [Chlamydiota bacterium]
MSQIKPLGARLLVKRTEAQTTKGGIYLPETAQEKPKQGTIVALGTENPSDVKVGDEVFFASYAGSEVKNDGQEGFLILPIEEVLCVVE